MRRSPLIFVFLFAVPSLAVTVGDKDKSETTYSEEEHPNKRQAELYNQLQGAGGPQYAQQQDVPPEFYNYLQQLSGQQAAALPAQPQAQAALAGRGPLQASPQGQQLFVNYRVPQPGGALGSAQAALPEEARLSPQALEQRRLQQEYADRSLREQQERALQQLFQPGPPAGTPPFRPLPSVTAAAAGSPAPRQYTQQELKALAEQQYNIAFDQQQFVIDPNLFAAQLAQAQGQQVQAQQSQAQPRPQQPQVTPLSAQPQRYSYSEIQFGNQPVASQRVKSHAPNPPTQPQQPQQAPSRPIVYVPQPQIEFYPVYEPQQTPSQPQLPEQYLIETTKPQKTAERVVTIPRPKQASQQSAQQQQLQYYRAQQVQQASIPRYQEDNSIRGSSSSAAPSRSAIYVSKAGQNVKPLYSLGDTIQQQFSGANTLQLQNAGRPNSQHPLSQNELNSLLQAGFQLSAIPTEARKNEAYLSGPTYYRQQTNKRQSKRVPTPVQLTDEERQSLAEQGIRNLYRVESSESQDAPVTYVLALDNSSLKANSNSRRNVQN